jgi:hypothetical protein
MVMNIIQTFVKSFRIADSGVIDSWSAPTHR